MQSPGLALWRKALRAVFGPLERRIEQRRVRESFSRPLVVGYGRDAVKFFENGRSVVVEAELMAGEVDRQLYRSSHLKWSDSGAELSPVERGNVFQHVCADFDRRKVRWRFYDDSAQEGPNPVVALLEKQGYRLEVQGDGTPVAIPPMSRFWRPRVSLGF